ncbi:MAG: thiamine diphosphokinase [Chloroflexi bacterium]|nr:thiamine diphosphokinase [Chloroflexota bacterium]
MRAIIVANGHVEEGENYSGLVRAGDLVIAADGGTVIALQLGLEPQAVVGDLDSLPLEVRRELEERGCQFLHYPARKDETDTELAIRYALEQGAEEIVLLAATGDRLDHTLANVFLLGMPQLRGKKACILTGRTEVWLLRGGEELTIQGQPGAIVTLLPVGQDAVGIHSSGLEWALRDDTLRFGLARGVSNVMTAEKAQVSLRAGLLLVFRVQEKGVAGERKADQLVEVCKEQGHLRANVIKAKLEAAGIPAILSYDAASLVFGLTVDGIGEVRILVRPGDAEEARRILAEEQTEGEAEEEGLS